MCSVLLYDNIKTKRAAIVLRHTECALCRTEYRYVAFVLSSWYQLYLRINLANKQDTVTCNVPLFPGKQSFTLKHVLLFIMFIFAAIFSRMAIIT